MRTKAGFGVKTTVRDSIFIALFAALTAVGAFIKIPTPIVPFTLQFLFCTYAGLLLGARNGLYSQLLYMFIGLIGIDVYKRQVLLSFLLFFITIMQVAMEVPKNKLLGS